MLFGNEKFSLPEGFTFPKRISARELPACSPAYHWARIAGMLSFSQGMAKGLPATSTNTIGLPVADTACINWLWHPVRLISCRSIPSPVVDGMEVGRINRVLELPQQRITTSLWRAIRTASSIRLVSIETRSHP